MSINLIKSFQDQVGPILDPQINPVDALVKLATHHDDQGKFGTPVFGIIIKKNEEGITCRFCLATRKSDISATQVVFQITAFPANFPHHQLLQNILQSQNSLPVLTRQNKQSSTNTPQN